MLCEALTAAELLWLVSGSFPYLPLFLSHYSSSDSTMDRLSLDKNSLSVHHSHLAAVSLLFITVWENEWSEETKVHFFLACLSCFVRFVCMSTGCLWRFRCRFDFCNLCNLRIIPRVQLGCFPPCLQAQSVEASGSSAQTHNQNGCTFLCQIWCEWLLVPLSPQFTPILSLFLFHLNLNLPSDVFLFVSSLLTTCFGVFIATS